MPGDIRDAAWLCSRITLLLDRLETKEKLLVKQGDHKCVLVCSKIACNDTKN